VSESSGEAGPERDAPAPLQRLDPDRAAGGSASGPPSSFAAPGPQRPHPEVIDTRRYRWMIGIFGLVVVIGVSVYQFATNGLGTTGVAPGQRLHLFAAPLANTNLNGDPNPSPICSEARHDPRSLNICLLVKRAPLVLDLFVTGARECIRQVDALQSLSRRFPAVQFAAVAINGDHAGTARLVRSHRWTIPVAYDRDGQVGSLYGVAACPMVEMAGRGGVVQARLVGDRWQSLAALAPHVRALLAR
jgi:hypothetical protein